MCPGGRRPFVMMMNPTKQTMNTTTETNTAATGQPPHMPDLPKPVAEHAWLQRFVGEWTSEAECSCGPDTPPMLNKGTETIRQLGGFWIISEIKSDSESFPFANLMTLGYDPEKKKYIGSWVDTMTSYMWRYEGSVDATGTTLTLETEGPCPMGGITKFREVMKLETPDHKLFTSSMLGPDGEWHVCVKGSARRKI